MANDYPRKIISPCHLTQAQHSSCKAHQDRVQRHKMDIVLLGKITAQIIPAGCDAPKPVRIPGCRERREWCVAYVCISEYAPCIKQPFKHKGHDQDYCPRNEESW